MEFYYSFLSEREKSVYRTIVDGVKNQRQTINLMGMTSSDQCMQLISKVSWDHPELFYVEFQRAAYISSAFGMQYKPHYYGSIAQITSQKQAIYDKAMKILRQMDAKKITTSYARIRWLHNYFVKNITYDYRSLTTQNHAAHSIYGVFESGSAVCEGISKAFKYVCDLDGVPVAVAVGNATSENFGSDIGHAWNLVLINEKWYHLDVTFDLGLSQSTKGYRYDYFFLPDAEIAKDHVFDIAVKCSDDDLSYFVQTHSLLRKRAEVQKFVDQQMMNGKKKFYFKVAIKAGQDWTNIIGQIDSMMLGVLSKQGGGRYSKTFNRSQGVFCYRLLEEQES